MGKRQRRRQRKANKRKYSWESRKEFRKRITGRRRAA